MATTWYQGLADGERNLFLSRHSFQPALVVYSKKWFNKLPADIQKVLTGIPHALTEQGRRDVRKMEPILIKHLKRYGYDVHTPTAAERAAFVKASKGLTQKIAKKAGGSTTTLLKAIQAAK